MVSEFPLLGTALAAGFLLLFQGAGVCAAFLLLPGERPGPRLLTGSVLGSVLAQWLPALWAFLFGFGLTAHFMAAWTALALGVLCLALGRRKGRRGFAGLWQGLGSRKFLWVGVFFWVFFCLLVWRGFAWEDGRIYSSQATYGDMSMHLSFITSLARQGGFPPEYPLLPGHLLSYPFLGDSISASLLVLEAPLRWAYCLPMWIAGAQVFAGFWLLARRLTGSGKAAGLAFLLFFGNGGLGFVYFLDGYGLSRLFTGFYQTPTNLVEENLRWVNVVVDMMLPQRATLFGWAVLFPALALLYRAVFDGEARLFPAAGVLAGALPMIHTHSFLALGLISAALLMARLVEANGFAPRAERALKIGILAALPGMDLLQRALRQVGALDAPALLGVVLGAAGAFVVLLGFLLVRLLRRGRHVAPASWVPELRVLDEVGGTDLSAPRGSADGGEHAAPASWVPELRGWGVYLGITLALALPQVLAWTLPQAGQGGFVRGHFGWAVGEEDYLWFYLKNLGLSALFCLGGLLTAKGEDFAKLSPALLVWFTAELVAFQPNDYDNNKLLYAAFALLICGGARFALALLERVRTRGLRGAAAGAALAVCLCSAGLTWGREWVSRYELFGAGAVELAAFVDENLPADAVVLTDTRHNNEIAALAGRTVVCGSPSYLYYHGLPYGRNQLAVQQMYEAPGEAGEWFRYFGVAHVLVSDFERHSYAVDQDWFDAHGKRIYDDGSRVLFEILDIRY